MHRTEQPEQQPTGPTTGPMRPLIVVMETTEGQGENPFPEQGTPQQDAEQDRLSPIPEEGESETPPAPPQPDEPNEPEPTPPPREPRPLSLPVLRVRSRFWSQARWASASSCSGLRSVSCW